METVYGERILIARGDIATTRRDSAEPRALRDGEALFRVRRVAITANNVTYAAAGDRFGYWRFFPGPEGFGVLPVWGFADVEESRADGLAPGDRFYGYWPLATHLVVGVADAGPAGFADPTQHRQGLSDFYNRYARVAERTAADEALEALFRPLFLTGWLIDRFVAGEGDFGAEQIVLSSASSKTAIATAFNIARRAEPRPRIVGLTSAANMAFVRSLGCYDSVVAYDGLEQLDAVPSVFVDFAGDRALTVRLHEYFGDQLQHSAIVGMTHWGAGGDDAVPGPTPTLFFAPTVAEQTVAALGPSGFAKASGEAFAAFAPFIGGKIDVETRSGLAAAEPAYRALATGSVSGAKAIIVEL